MADSDVPSLPTASTPLAGTEQLYTVQGGADRKTTVAAILALAAPASHVGEGGSAHAVATTGAAGFLSGSDKSKLDSIASGATANSSDATLLNRANHTGTQAISTVSGLQSALDGKAAAEHGHDIEDVTDLQSALDGKAPASHTHTEDDITGTIAPAKLAQSGAANGEVLKWNGSAWAPAADNDSGGGGGGSGTVTSVDVSGGTTGLSTSGGPVTTSGTITLAGTLAVANGGTGATDAAGARSNLGAAAATHTHPYSDLTSIPAAIDAIDGLTPAADRIAYYTSGSAAALATLTSFARDLLDDTDATTARGTLGLGGAATLNVGTTAGTVAAGDDSRITGAVQTSRQVNSGTGLTGGGNLSADRTLALDGQALAYHNLSLGANQVAVKNNANNAMEARSRKVCVPVFLPLDANVAETAAGGQVMLWPSVPTTLSSVRVRTLVGTCDVQVFKNGAAINGFGSAVSQTTSVTGTSSAETLTTDDRLSVAVTNASSLTGLFVTFIGVETGA